MRTAHALAWQSRRGARHKGTSANPQGPAQRGVVPPGGAQRNDWRNFAEDGLMLKRAERAIYPGGAVPLPCR
jgi:3-mercaptopyruvate sulfurtransferase SseA